MVVVAVVLVVIIVVMLLRLLLLLPVQVSASAWVLRVVNDSTTCNGDAVFSLIIGGTCIPSRNFMGGARTWQLRACRRAGAQIFGEG